MSKDKKKKKNKKDSAASPAVSLKVLASNPLVADVVAAALVATASALKDSNKARRLAEDAGDELAALSKKSAAKGNVLWQLALDIGRQALDTLTENPPAKSSKTDGEAKKPKRSPRPKG